VVLCVFVLLEYRKLLHKEKCTRYTRHQVRTPSDQDQDRPNFLDSLRVARCGAINRGVFTSGSLTPERRARVDAFVDRGHCRLIAQRSEYLFMVVLEHLARSVRYGDKNVFSKLLSKLTPYESCPWYVSNPPGGAQIFNLGLGSFVLSSCRQWQRSRQWL